MEAKKLDSCTPGQRLVIETFDKPLMVAAGAGSGKTFTLTQRTVNAFSPASGVAPVVQSLDEVLVITFTKKAAAELKDRIRRNLAEEGFAEAASRVDTAWVSTIHGMASRILRENALELGIDPAFEVISQTQTDELYEQALNEVIKDVTPEDALLYELLTTDSLAAQSGGSFSKSNVRSQASTILGRVEALPASFEGLVIEQPTKSPWMLLATLLEHAQEYYGLFDEWLQPTFDKKGKAKAPKGLSATEEKAKASFEQAILLAQAWLEVNSELSFTDEKFDAEDFFEVFFAFPKLSATFGKSREALGFTEAYRAVYAELAVESMAHAGYKRLMAVVKLSKQVNERFKELKGVSRMDNTDLLRNTYEALRDHEAIANKYRDQFKLIMVDEFQDTDKLQVALIKLLAQPDLRNVCTVGDAQQSIYRFRGADVEVFKDYRSELSAINDQAKQVELGDNFRSHGDVLAIVDTIFRQQNAFGGEFLHLEPKGKVNAAANPVFDQVKEGSLPRITFDIVQYKKRYGGVGLSSEEALVLGARRIAEHFAGLVSRDVASGSMALLLGRMTNADLYAQALREVGIESVIAGGSVFCRSEEALLVNNLLRVAVNRQDEEALFAVLISPLFSLSDDALLILSRGAGLKGTSLSKGFFAVDLAVTEAEESGEEAVACEDVASRVSAARIQQQLSAEDGFLWVWARDLLRTFIAQARTGSATAAMRQLFVHAGLFTRLESLGAEGIAAAGNLAKALHLTRGFEEDSSGIASLAQAYSSHLATAKEAPGALSTENASCLKIMTVHSSKGLEFDHVALADMKSGVENRAALVVENVGDSTYASLSLGYSAASRSISELRELFDTSCADDISSGLRTGQTPGLRHEVLASLQQRHELEEAQRLLYVALTRAVESLYVECVNEGDPASKTFAYKGIMDVISTALNWDDQGKTSRSLVEYGGSAPAVVNFTFLANEEDLAEALEPYEESQSETGGEFVIPIWADVEFPTLQPAPSSRAGVESYSSLSGADHEGDDVVSLSVFSEGDEAIAEEAVVSGVSSESLEEVSATDFGSAFHELAQRAILLAQAEGAHALPMPSRAEIEEKLARYSIAEQAERLEEALRRWIFSDLAKRFMNCASVDAEVPFMVPFVNDAGDVRYLEGSIDALGVLETGEALLVDYKTGGFANESASALRAKHALQAACYSYALLDAGYPSVDANFVRMEQQIQGSDQPQVVHYRFTQAQKEALREKIHGLMFSTAVKAEVAGL